VSGIIAGAFFAIGLIFDVGGVGEGVGDDGLILAAICFFRITVNVTRSILIALGRTSTNTSSN